MGILCKTEYFVSALNELIYLLSDEYLKKKGIKEKIAGVDELENFLFCVSIIFKERKISSYETLISILERVELLENERCELDQETVNVILSYMGKLLDAIQVIKPYTDRYKKMEYFLSKALARTGHEYIFDYYKSERREELNSILNEIRQTVAASILLEIVARIYANASNPISSLRRSMGDRYPEEYFSEMMAGWMAEKYFQELLEGNFSIQREGVDKDFNVLLTKPPKMGGADFVICGKKVELQRSSIDKFEIKEIENNDIQKIFMETPLKEHKLKNADFIILWIGNADCILNKRCEKSFFWFMKINPLLTLFSIKGGRSKSFFTGLPNVPKRSPCEGYDAAHELVSDLNDKINEVLRILKGNKHIWSFDNVMSVLSEEKKRKFVKSYDLRNKLETIKNAYEEKKKDSSNSARTFLVGKLEELEILLNELTELLEILTESKNAIEGEDEKIELRSEDEKIYIEMKKNDFDDLLSCETEIVEKIRKLLFQSA